MKKTILTLALSILCLMHYGQRITVYKQCANDLSYSELGLEADVKSIELEGAKMIDDRCTSSMLSIDPFVPRVEIHGISSKTKKDTSLVLRVRSAPAPKFDLFCHGAPVTEENRATAGDTLSFELVVDPEFAAQYPGDANIVPWASDISLRIISLSSFIGHFSSPFTTQV